MSSALILMVVKSYLLNSLSQRVQMRSEGLEIIPELCAGLPIKLLFAPENQSPQSMIRYLTDPQGLADQHFKPAAHRKPTMALARASVYTRDNCTPLIKKLSLDLKNASVTVT